ncbi:disulfide oxidoreductase (plasmid) [Paenibacillus urinalis]|uniref:Disulfide oxidoreductase n=1 Tax=Paenibacillus urinalis TaxID=521520 RepID=A0AAX3N869_9BACL|nr:MULTISPECIES: disulfide oxidoreductase [Paenibacillus]MCM3131066.1 disulfide oxidoreductase [Paenibacillus sp. MER 78]WDH85344.1 disulfide oxidoreductase [Paenibacillus urinalis]WDH95216.1 disulfide oxidoreductase [Paenibacillus urinalis]WDI05307.1 disulfide oxidoreductase [Paenibacillus urinalis]
MVVLRDQTLYLAWIVAVTATLGSLYFSEIRGFIPCELCWYQRILMYPLSILLGIAAFYSDKNIKKYVLPLSIFGACLSLFHYLQQKLPGFASIKPCTSGVPCNIQYINWLNFITIPFLALTAFTFISLLLILTKAK